MSAIQELNGHCPTPTRVNLAHLRELRASGLSDGQIEAAGLYTESDPKRLAEMLHWGRPAAGLGPALVFPFVDADGSRSDDYCRLKFSKPRRDREGKAVKYESPRGVSNRPYFPPATVGVLGDASVPLVVTEGEKKSLKADQEGFPCVGLVGVWGWQKKRSKDADGRGVGERQLIDGLAAVAWKGRTVYLCFDSDAAPNDMVRRAEVELAGALMKLGASVRIVRLPQGSAGDDGTAAKVGLDDYLVAHSADEFRALMTSAEEVPSAAGGKRKKKRKKESQSTRLVQLVLSSCELFHDGDGVGYVAVTVAQHVENWPLRSKGFRQWLGGAAFKSEGRAPGSQAVADAVNVLEGYAVHAGQNRRVAIRVAGSDGSIYLDLANGDWSAVQIDADGWRVRSDLAGLPFRFRRMRGLQPLPEPQRGGSLNELRDLVNVSDDGDWLLIVGYLCAALRPSGPYPVLNLCGEQGTAKSSCARLIRATVDPSRAPLRSEPREARDLMIAANNGWVIALDNLSAIPQWLSDALCRLATGGGFSTRLLYSDDEEMIFDAQRPVILAAITDIVKASDLGDRTIFARLAPIPDDRRVTEDDLNRKFEAARPRILGALCDAVAAGLRELPGVKLDRLPRMADFAKWAEACCRGLGYPPGAFLRAYDANRADAAGVFLSECPVVEPLRTFLGEQQGEWEGTATDLYDALSRIAGESVTKRKDWPKLPQVLTGKLKKIAPNLRADGIEVGEGRTAKRRTLVIKLIKEYVGERASSASSASQDRKSRGEPDDARPAESVTERHRASANGPLFSANDAGDAGDAEFHSLSDCDIASNSDGDLGGSEGLDQPAGGRRHYADDGPYRDRF